MAFDSISKRINSLPLIVSGPMVRRVTNDSVTIWVALRKKQVVELIILDSNYSPIPALTNAETTRQLGESLHIAVITSKPVAATNALSSNNIYFYNLNFEEGTMISEDGSLGPGIVITDSYLLPEGLAYKDYKYPSFILPSDNLSYLKFVHASCRKPHGGETDALRGLDTILDLKTLNLAEYPSASEERSRLINERPQFLCLTGDQIYADDVADILLYLLIDAATVILNWGDYLNNETVEVLPKLTKEGIKPGKRQNQIAMHPDEIRAEDQFPSSAAKSHLLRLGEFYMMYLFVWSDVLWPLDPKNNFLEFKDLFPNETEFSPGSAIFPGNSKKKQTHLNEKKALLVFHASLKSVRRALANIPTYMIFDDHEITDDWFATAKFVRNTLKDGFLTKRVILNGLAAYAIFQDWGNDPEKYTSGTGKEILDALENVHLTQGTDNQIWTELGSKLLPSLVPFDNNFRLAKGFEWHYYIDFQKFRLLILDTRTKRGYYADQGFPALISSAVLEENLHINDHLHPTQEVVIAVSPGPVFGNMDVEWWQRKAKDNIILAWVLEGKTGMYFKDQEAWIFNRLIYEQFLEKLSTYKKVIILSGDVHYSFSISLKYWNFRNAAPGYSAIAQLCSSSLKNSDSGTNKAATWPSLTPGSDSDFELEYDVVCWVGAGMHINKENVEVGLTPVKLRGRVASQIMKFKRGVFPKREHLDNFRLIDGHPPNWGYRIFFVLDDRKSEDRATTILNSDTLSVHKKRLDWDEQRTVVGKDVIGLVTFSDWPNNKIKHSLWYVANPLISSDVLQPHTEHVLDLVPPDENTPTPGTGKK